METMSSGPSFAALIGDVVGSRRAADRAGMQGALHAAFELVNRRVAAAQPLMSTLGDEFQALYHDLESAYAVTLRLRLELIGVADVRFGIGWGEITHFDPTRVPFAQDGPCWWRARDALDDVADRAGRHGQPSSLRTRCRTSRGDESLINAFLGVRDEVLRGLDGVDAHILIGLMDGRTQTQLAEELGVNKSTVSRRVSAHGLAALMHAQPDAAGGIA